MTKEIEMLEYNDALVGFVSIVQQHGAQKVLRDFERFYPSFFKEIKIQINRFPEKPVAALLKK